MINCTTTPTICQMNLLNVNRWHHGMYECVATNTIATIGRFYELDVQCKCLIEPTIPTSKWSCCFLVALVPPDVQSSTSKSLHSIGDTITLHCLIDANPEPDIRWLHRFNNDINQQIDISRHIDQGIPNGNYQHNTSVSTTNRRMTPSWSIEQEKINSTRWKTTLIVKVKRRETNAIELFISILAPSETIFQFEFRLSSSESSWARWEINSNPTESSSPLPSSSCLEETSTHQYSENNHHPNVNDCLRAIERRWGAIIVIYNTYVSIELAQIQSIHCLIAMVILSDSSSQDLKDMTSNHSGKMTPYLFYSFLLGLFIFLSKWFRSSHLFPPSPLRPWPIE